MPGPATTTLLTKWQIDSTYESGGTAATLYQKNRIQVLKPGTASAEFTTTMLTIYAGAAIDKQLTYTQSGNVLYIGHTGASTDIYNDRTVKVLTTKRLVLVGIMPGTNGQPNSNFTITTTYSR
jgi:hypothetical protein